MASRKPSANARKAARLESGTGDLDGLFEAESASLGRMAGKRGAALRNKGCSSKVRYASRAQAEDAADRCAEHGRAGLSVYPCDRCGGWHLTSHPRPD